MSIPRIPFAVGALVALAGPAHAAVLNADGDGLHVQVDSDLGIQVYRGEEQQLAGPGIIASVDGRLIGEGLEGASPWTPVWQSRVSGDGSAEQPYSIATVVGVEGLELTATVRYVAGADSVSIDLQVDGNDSVRLYHLIDNRPNDPASTYWSAAQYGATAPTKLGLITDHAQVEMIAGEAGWEHDYAGEHGLPQRAAVDGQDLDDSLDGAASADRTIAIGWSGGWSTIDYTLRFAELTCEHCDDPPDGPGLGTSGVDPSADDGSGSDDVGPPPSGGDQVPGADEDPTSLGDDGDPSYGAATDDAAGCSASGGGLSGGASLVLIGLAAGCLGRRGRGARAARRGTR